MNNDMLEGYMARMQEKHVSNPHKYGSEEFYYWATGWSIAVEDYMRILRKCAEQMQDQDFSS